MPYVILKKGHHAECTATTQQKIIRTQDHRKVVLLEDSRTMSLVVAGAPPSLSEVESLLSQQQKVSTVDLARGSLVDSSSLAVRAKTYTAFPAFC
jgi:hypothetical protein